MERIMNLKNRKLILILWVFFCLASLYGCWDTKSTKDQTIINASNYTLTYNWNTKLEKILIQSDDMNEITDLYQESWVKDWDFKDSLLVAKVFAQWRWVNTFAQDNLDTLEIQWLKLDNIQKKQILIKKNGNKINCVLVEYDITEWFVSEVPILYISQLFVPDDGNIILYSFITENKKSRTNASNMLINIK